MTAMIEIDSVYTSALHMSAQKFSGNFVFFMIYTTGVIQTTVLEADPAH